MTKLYIKKGIKFRKEKAYILICDCVNFLDFQLPLNYYNLLTELKKGLDISKNKISEQEKTVIHDLEAMDLLTTAFNVYVQNNNKFLETSYNEIEFF